jgi:ABC-type polysaccharide/polyol phosphate transport system ATPase subunit
MESRIRSARSQDVGTAGVGRSSKSVLMQLVLGTIFPEPGAAAAPHQHRIIIKLAMAMIAALRSAPRERTAMHVTDIAELDDENFERIIATLRHVRSALEQESSSESAH